MTMVPAKLEMAYVSHKRLHCFLSPVITLLATQALHMQLALKGELEAGLSSQARPQS